MAGGAILAAIEGLNVVLMRVLMPLLEKQQAEAGVEIDRLIPPVDPSRPRVPRTQRKQLWEENPSPSPLYTNNPFANNNSNPFATTPFPPSSGSSSTGQWDTPGYRSEPTSSTETTQETKSSWKFW